MARKTRILYTLDRARFMDMNGRPLKNGYIRFRRNKSSNNTPLPPIWADPQEDIALPNPLPIDYDGFVPISGVWLDISEGKKYSVDVLEKVGFSGETEARFSLYWSMDNIPGFDFGSIGVTGGSVAALEKIPDNDNAITLLNGYWVAGDRGGGVFYWDKDSAEQEDNGIVFRPTDVASGAPGRWKRVLSDSRCQSAWWGVYGREFTVGQNFQSMVKGMDKLCRSYPFSLTMNAGYRTQTIKLGGGPVAFQYFKVYWEKGCVIEDYSSVALREDCELPRGLVFGTSKNVSLTNHGIKCQVYTSNFNSEFTLNGINGLTEANAPVVFDQTPAKSNYNFFTEPQTMPLNTTLEVMLGRQEGLNDNPTLYFSKLPKLAGDECGIDLSQVEVEVTIIVDTFKLSDWVRTSSEVTVNRIPYKANILVADIKCQLKGFSVSTLVLRAAVKCDKGLKFGRIIYEGGTITGAIPDIDSSFPEFDFSAFPDTTLEDWDSYLENKENVTITGRYFLKGAPKTAGRLVFSRAEILTDAMPLPRAEGQHITFTDCRIRITVGEQTHSFGEVAFRNSIISQFNYFNINSKCSIENCNTNFSIKVAAKTEFRCVNSSVIVIELQADWSNIEITGNTIGTLELTSDSLPTATRVVIKNNFITDSFHMNQAYLSTNDPHAVSKDSTMEVFNNFGKNKVQPIVFPRTRITASNNKQGSKVYIGNLILMLIAGEERSYYQVRRASIKNIDCSDVSKSLLFMELHSIENFDAPLETTITSSSVEVRLKVLYSYLGNSSTTYQVEASVDLLIEGVTL